SRLSPERETTSSAPFCSTRTAFGTATAPAPRGPFSSTEPPAPSAPARRDTVTPLGTFTGSLPTRDISARPHGSRFPSAFGSPARAQHLAADLLLARETVGKNPLRRREDAHAEPAADLGSRLRADVDAEARPAHAPDAGDHRASRGVVAQADTDLLPGALA